MTRAHYSLTPSDGRIPDGVLRQMARFFQENEGKQISIDLSIDYPKRSTNQNKYYWAVVVEGVILGVKDTWGEHIGKDEAHELLKVNCNFKSFANENNEVVNLPESTKELSTAQFEDYLERCRRFVYKWFNFQIALPNE